MFMEEVKRVARRAERRRVEEDSEVWKGKRNGPQKDAMPLRNVLFFNT